MFLCLIMARLRAMGLFTAVVHCTTVRRTVFSQDVWGVRVNCSSILSDAFYSVILGWSIRMRARSVVRASVNLFLLFFMGSLLGWRNEISNFSNFFLFIRRPYCPKIKGVLLMIQPFFDLPLCVLSASESLLCSAYHCHSRVPETRLLACLVP